MLPNDHLNAFACQSDSETNAFGYSWNAHEMNFVAPTNAFGNNLVADEMHVLVF